DNGGGENGNGTEPPPVVDGRHPRVRAHQVHLFNNFFDHIAQHAIGAAGGGPSIFAESNYFLRSRNPMLISRQGSDIAGGGTGTFSGEDGGMIKAYGNFMCEWTLQRFSPWSPGNTEQFDAFVVGNRLDPVPPTVVSRQGGWAFSNFDLNLPYTYTASSAREARAKVERYAGRFWGGDISFAFGAIDVGADRNFRNPDLDALLFGYRSRLVAIQGKGSGAGDNGGGENGNGTEPPPVVDGRQVFNFSLAPFDAGFPTSARTAIGGLVFGSGFSRDTQNAAAAGYGFTHMVRPGGRASATQRYLIIPIEGPARITLFASSNNSSATFVNVHDGAGGANIGRIDLPGWVAGGGNINQPAPFTVNTVGPREVALKADGNIRVFKVLVENLGEE
ncbi:MAG: hypothetical protein FWD88_06340, partial [Treponema sp.]|nr:hypothetical protein [Treponema sp.]